MDISNIEINEQFSKALRLMEEGGRPLFVTGKAGTGKSTLLAYFRATTKRKIVVLAPTGVAAVNIAGQTIHSFFGFKPDITVEKAERLAKKTAKTERADIYRSIDTLVIDEISMVRADLFDCVDRFMRVVCGKRQKSFGGTHLAMIGDLYQLPPVVTSAERQIFQGHYKSPYFFDSRAFGEMDVHVLELEKIYRQHDERFIAILNAVRNNTIGDKDIGILNERCDPRFEFKEGSYIHLTSLNKEAKDINDRKLDALKGRVKHYEARVSGAFDEKSFPADMEIRLKVGAQVMMLNNDSLGRWINGTIGEVTAIGNDSVSVRLPDGTVEGVDPYTWRMFRFELDHKGGSIISTPVGNFTQMPLMLAWAVTIHKSQGKTFDKAVIDVGRVFTSGQAYVALSRVRSMDGIALKTKLKKGHVRVDWRVVNFLTGRQYASSEKRMPIEDKVKAIKSAVETGALIEMTYLKASDTKSKRIIKPLEVGMMEYADRPFLGVRGMCRLRNEERVFRVDRILEMKVVK
jgi:ATP-dependent exoDNAse (exonuclease V) alpha subunit